MPTTMTAIPKARCLLISSWSANRLRRGTKI